MKRVSQIMAGINMVTFGSLTKHFVMILVEYFSIIYAMIKNIILQMIMEKVKTKTKIKKQQLPCDIRSSFEHLQQYIWTDVTNKDVSSASFNLFFSMKV